VKPLDLAAQPLPHLSGNALARGDQAEAAEGDAALADFVAADVVVIGAPMYNFAIPSQLKAWIDRITVAGKTFRYTASGVQGLAGGKQVIVAVSSGGVDPADVTGDFVVPYLRHLFAFLGIENVRFVRAEGLAVSACGREQGLNAALAAAMNLPLARAA